MLWKAVDSLVCYRELVCARNEVTSVFLGPGYIVDYEDSEILAWRQSNPCASRTSASR